MTNNRKQRLGDARAGAERELEGAPHYALRVRRGRRGDAGRRIRRVGVDGRPK